MDMVLQVLADGERRAAFEIRRDRDATAADLSRRTRRVEPTAGHAGVAVR
jgi:hypothetical protein